MWLFLLTMRSIKSSSTQKRIWINILSYKRTEITVDKCSKFFFLTIPALSKLLPLVNHHGSFPLVAIKLLNLLVRTSAEIQMESNITIYSDFRQKFCLVDLKKKKINHQPKNSTHSDLHIQERKAAGELRYLILEDLMGQIWRICHKTSIQHLTMK